MSGLSACSDDDKNSRVDLAQVDAVEPPELGACRVLTPDDVGKTNNATKTLDCAEPHTAETFAVGTIPESIAATGYKSEKLGLWAYKTCAAKFAKFLAADESLVMRSIVSWAWFLRSGKGWKDSTEASRAGRGGGRTCLTGCGTLD